MIVGWLSSDREPIVSLTVHGRTATAIDAVVDTGFTGYLSLARRHRRAMRLLRVGREAYELADGTLVSEVVYRGEVTFDAKRRRYVRRHRELYLLLPRKSGKTEMLAAICLYLLVGEGEEAAEIYGLAMDKDQAMHVFRRCARMVALSRDLSRRLEVVR